MATVPMDRLGHSEEIADAIMFTASGEASFITGHILNVDGGKTANRFPSPIQKEVYYGKFFSV